MPFLVSAQLHPVLPPTTKTFVEAHIPRVAAPFSSQRGVPACEHVIGGLIIKGPVTGAVADERIRVRHVVGMSIAKGPLARGGRYSSNSIGLGVISKSAARKWAEERLNGGEGDFGGRSQDVTSSRPIISFCVFKNQQPRDAMAGSRVPHPRPSRKRSARDEQGSLDRCG